MKVQIITWYNIHPIVTLSIIRSMHFKLILWNVCDLSLYAKKYYYYYICEVMRRIIITVTTILFTRVILLLLFFSCAWYCYYYSTILNTPVINFLLISAGSAGYKQFERATLSKNYLLLLLQLSHMKCLATSHQVGSSSARTSNLSKFSIIVKARSSSRLENSGYISLWSVVLIFFLSCITIKW